MKCAICGREIETTFLGKIKGCYIKKDGKIYAICNKCQSELGNDKNKILQKIK